jgi:hypothetical protein
MGDLEDGLELDRGELAKTAPTAPALVRPLDPDHDPSRSSRLLLHRLRSSEFLRSQAHAILAFDFLTVETAWPRTLPDIR